MSDNSKISWCDSTWNVTAGCDKVSAGCAYCWATRMDWRLQHAANQAVSADHSDLCNSASDWTGKVRCFPNRLDQPLHWKKPRKVFVNSMSDLFHDKVPEAFIRKVFDVESGGSGGTLIVVEWFAARQGWT